MKALYENFAKKAGGDIEVRPFLFEDNELTVSSIQNFSAAAAPGIVKDDYPHLHGHRLRRQQAFQGLGFKDDCTRVESGTLTIIDLSDPFVDANTACSLFEICHGIILKRHKEAYDAKQISPGLILSLDEAHKFLDKDLPAAETFTASLLTTIREQRHNAARVVIATQEPSISEKIPRPLLSQHCAWLQFAGVVHDDLRASRRSGIHHQP